jgi:hypothetical protein
MKQSKRRKNEEPAASGMNAAEPDQGAIARRAYEVYLERGAEAGHELDDWLLAEAELRGGHG